MKKILEANLSNGKNMLLYSSYFTCNNVCNKGKNLCSPCISDVSLLILLFMVCGGQGVGPSLPIYLFGNVASQNQMLQ